MKKSDKIFFGGRDHLCVDCNQFFISKRDCDLCLPCLGKRVARVFTGVIFSWVLKLLFSWKRPASSQNDFTDRERIGDGYGGNCDNCNEYFIEERPYRLCLPCREGFTDQRKKERRKILFWQFIEGLGVLLIAAVVLAKVSGY